MGKKKQKEAAEPLAERSSKRSYVPKPKTLGPTAKQRRQQLKRTAKCLTCQRPVRCRLSDNRIVWHRGSRSTRKWCPGGGSFVAARPKAIPIVAAEGYRAGLLVGELGGLKEL